MDIKHAAQVIRDTVTMDQILDLYGYQPKHGFMVCPFHGDHDASLKVYKETRGWHCFGCGKGGSVIDFVMEHEGCDLALTIRTKIHTGRRITGSGSGTLICSLKCITKNLMPER